MIANDSSIILICQLQNKINIFYDKFFVMQMFMYTRKTIITIEHSNHNFLTYRNHESS